MIEISVMKELNLLHYTIQYKILRTEKKRIDQCDTWNIRREVSVYFFKNQMFPS